ncbi:hypothetical protein EGK76_08470 [Luteimonas sp. 100069]|nr:hypothetical protein EGK76_08470 [Luteimonas sp. 100069]
MYRTALVLSLALLLAAPARTAGTDATPPFTTAAALEQWLAHNASPLDRMPPYARALFLDSLRFGPRGLHTLPVDILLAELTSEEALAVQRLLLEDTYPFPGLAPDEAVRLRAARADGSLAPPTDAMVSAYRDWQDASPDAVDGDTAVANIEQLIANEVTSASTGGEDLRLLHRAAMGLAQSTGRDTHVDAARVLHGRLQSHGLVTRNDHRDMQHALLRSGRIEEARAFTASLSDLALPPVPHLDTSYALTEGDVGIWKIIDDDAAAPTLQLEAIDLRTRIVVVSSPGCGFSNAAAAAIPDDPELGPLFARHATWLMAPTAIAEASMLRDWNRRRPLTPIHIAVDAGQWPISSFDATPHFLAFRDGALVERYEGWQRDGSSRDAVHAMLVRAGLLRSTGAAPSAGDNPQETSGHR